jgi:hypothetical protein
MPLKLLLADRKLGAASKLAFLQLWDFAGQQPGRVVITADWLGSTCGRSPKAAWLWLEELQSHDLVKIGERNERRGSVVVDVYNPCPGGRCETASDPQTRLPIGSGEITPAIGGDGTRSVAATISEVSSPKPPSPLVPKKVQELSYQSTNVSKNSTSMNSRSGETASGMAQVGTAVAAAIAVAFDPAEQKMRLKRRIVAACGSATPVADWVAGSAANLVVYHDVPIQELNQVLVDLDAMRAVGSLQHAGKFFHAKAKQLADRFGKPWPRPR